MTEEEIQEERDEGQECQTPVVDDEVKDDQSCMPKVVTYAFTHNRISTSRRNL